MNLVTWIPLPLRGAFIVAHLLACYATYCTPKPHAPYITFHPDVMKAQPIAFDTTSTNVWIPNGTTSITIGNAMTGELDVLPTRRHVFKNYGRELFYTDADGVVHIARGVTATDIARGTARIVEYLRGQLNATQDELERSQIENSNLRYDLKYCRTHFDPKACGAR